MSIDWSKLTDAEIVELEELYRLKDIDSLKSALNNPNPSRNCNLYQETHLSIPHD